MGKAIIRENVGNGIYTVELDLDIDRYLAYLAHFEARIAEFDSAIASAVISLGGTEILSERQEIERQIKAIQGLRLNAVKRLAYLQSVGAPSNPILQVWCADLTENLAVGTIVGMAEIPGERTANAPINDPLMNIRPAWEGRADYLAARDGVLQPAVSGLVASTWINYSLRPGVQKWLPQYRYGTISDFDGTSETFDISLDPALSSDQGLNVNQSTTLSAVAAEYMDCDADAFDIGDQVLVEFPDRDWATPKIIGFRNNPKECTIPVVLFKVKSFYWAEIPYPDLWLGYTTVVVSSGGDPSFWELRPNIIEFLWDIGNNEPITYIQGPDGEGYTLPILTMEKGVILEYPPRNWDDYFIGDPRQYITRPMPTEWLYPDDIPNSGAPTEQFEAPPDYDDAMQVFGQYLPDMAGVVHRGTMGAWSPKVAVHTFFQANNATNVFYCMAGIRQFSPPVVHGDTPPTMTRNPQLEAYIEARLEEVGEYSGYTIMIPGVPGGGWDDGWYYRESQLGERGQSQVYYIRSGRISRDKITPP